MWDKEFRGKTSSSKISYRVVFVVRASSELSVRRQDIPDILVLNLEDNSVFGK